MLRSTLELSAPRRRSYSCYAVSYRRRRTACLVAPRAVSVLEPSTDVEGASLRRYAGLHPSGNNGKGSPSQLVRLPLVLEDSHPALSERGRASDSESDMVVSPQVIRSPHNLRSYVGFITQFSSKVLFTYQISEAVVAPDCSITSGATARNLSNTSKEQNVETYSSMGCRRRHHRGLRLWYSRQPQNQRV